MDWTVVIFVIIAVFLFVKVISKLVRLLLGIALISMIIYVVFSWDTAMLMF